VVRRAESYKPSAAGKPLPLGITPHKLRHTLASILVAMGKDPNYGDEIIGSRARPVAVQHGVVSARQR
jgi:integrase